MSFSRSDFANWILLGEGGESRVFLAQQLSLQRKVIIKQIIHKDTSRFQQEAILLAGLKHRGLVNMVDFGEEKGSFFMVQEYIRSVSLQECGGGFSGRTVRHLLQGLLETLIYVHKKNFIHRDLKPGNILVDSLLNVHLIDFGMSHHRYDDPDLRLLGTPSYFSPEQWMRTPLEPPADIFALGACAYFMFTGRTLFEGESLEEIRDKVFHEPRDYSGVPANWVPFLEKCLAVTVKNRFEEGEEAMEYLSLIKDESPLNSSGLLAEQTRMEELIRSREIQMYERASERALKAREWKSAYFIFKEWLQLEPGNQNIAERLKEISPKLKGTSPGIMKLWAALMVIVVIITGMILVSAWLQSSENWSAREERLLSPPPEAVLSAGRDKTADPGEKSVRRLVFFPHWQDYESLLINGEGVILNQGEIWLKPGVYPFTVRLKKDAVELKGSINVEKGRAPQIIWSQ